MTSRFDHAVVIVPSLKRAVRSFERLGFRVVLGGRTGPVHDALILTTRRVVNTSSASRKPSNMSAKKSKSYGASRGLSERP
jgi:hypothetical protein